MDGARAGSPGIYEPHTRSAARRRGVRRAGGDPVAGLPPQGALRGGDGTKGRPAQRGAGGQGSGVLLLSS
jgi:hypothetical protein